MFLSYSFPPHMYTVILKFPAKRREAPEASSQLSLEHAFKFLYPFRHLTQEILLFLYCVFMLFGEHLDVYRSTW